MCGIFGVTRIAAVIALTSQVIGVEEDLLAQQALELVLQEHRTKQMSVHHPPPERVPILIWPALKNARTAPPRFINTNQTTAGVLGIG
jgi:hypothetical protein